MNEIKIIEIYNELREGKRKKLQRFWNKESAKLVLRYVVFNILNWEREDMCNRFIKDDIVKKFKLTGALKKFEGSKSAFIIYSFPEYIIKKWEIVGSHVGNVYWKNDINKEYALKWFVNKLLEDGIIETVEDIPKVISQDLFNKYRLRGLLANYFNDSPLKAINFIFPDKFNLLDFQTRYSDNTLHTKENLLNILRDIFLNELSCNNREDIIDNARDIFFDERKLNIFIKKFYSDYRNALIDAFPEYSFFYWEFRQLPSTFWNSKQNRNRSLKELIENKLKINLKDIPKYINYIFIHENYKKFAKTCYSYYDSNYFKWVNEAYPELFEEDEYYKIFTKSSKISGFDSNSEKEIYNYIKNNITQNVKFIGRNRKYKLYNKKHNESYIFDFLINDNIICEYYGLYEEDTGREFIEGYVLKTKRKNNFYKDFCTKTNYKFVDLYPSDLLNNFEGIKNKINNILLEGRCD